MPPGRHQGRISYVTGRGPRSLPVHFVAGQRRVLLVFPSFNEATGYLPGQMVTLDVDDPAATSASEPLHFTGRARLVPDQEVPDATADLLECWPSGVGTHFVAVDDLEPLRH